MSEVKLRIAGRTYHVSCEDGQEAHIEHLGGMIADKLDAMGGNLAPQEAQNLLFAGLFLADELHELKNRLGDSADRKTRLEQAERELTNLRAERDRLSSDLSAAKAAKTQDPAPAPSEGHAELLEKVADSLEKCATSLESRATTP